MDSSHRDPGTRSSVTTSFWRQAQWIMYCKPGCLSLLGLRLDPGPGPRQGETRLHTMITGQPTLDILSTDNCGKLLRTLPLPLMHFHWSLHPPITGKILYLSVQLKHFMLPAKNKRAGKRQEGMHFPEGFFRRWVVLALRLTQDPLPSKATRRSSKSRQCWGRWQPSRVPTSTGQAWPTLWGEQNKTLPEASLQP